MVAGRLAQAWKTLAAVDVQVLGQIAGVPSTLQPVGSYTHAQWSTPQAFPWASAAAWLLGLGALSTSPALADTPASSASSGATASPDVQAKAAEVEANLLTNNPLDYDPVTNEHTARMTMARAAALEYYQAGKYKQAETKFREAMEESKLGFGPRDPHIASTTNNLAEFYRNTGQFDRAEVLYKQAMQLLEEAYGEKHWLYVAAMHNLAVNYEAAGRYQEAKQTMEAVLQLRLTMFGPTHFLYADSMFALAIILRKIGGQNERALQLMSDAVGILEQAESVQTSVLLAWLLEMSELYEKEGQLSNASNAVRKAIYHLGNEKGEAVAQASQLSDTLAAMLLRSQQPDAAKQVMQDCVNARTAVFGRELVVAQSLLRLAEIEAVTGQAADTAASLQSARNAAALAQDLLADANKGGGSLLFAGPKPDKILKRGQASHILASSLKFLAAAQTKDRDHAAAINGLQQAVAVLQPVANEIGTQLQAAQNGRAPPGLKPGGLQELAGQYVELQLLHMDCLDKLAEALLAADAAGIAVPDVAVSPKSIKRAGAADDDTSVAAKAAALRAQTEQIAVELLRLGV